MKRLLPPKLVFSQFTRSLDRWRAQGGLVLLYGSEHVLAYAMQAIASGFLHNLYDEDVALREAWRIFRKAVAHLRALADAGTLVLAVCPTPAACPIGSSSWTPPLLRLRSVQGSPWKSRSV